MHLINRTIIAMALLTLTLPGHGKDAITGKDIPQVLGVWYGQYRLSEQAPLTEMWLEFSFQKAVNGYTVRGYNRWNVLVHGDDQADGAQSLGKHAEHFDTISGAINHAGDAIELAEDHSKTRLHARISDNNTLQVRFNPDSDDGAFDVTLNRIDMHYSPGVTTLLGVDVSHHSGAIDWRKVQNQGFHFAYVKSSEGVDNPDAMFEQHWRQLGELDFPRGAYHFYVTEDDPVQQARFFASRLADDPGTLPPVVDIELLGNNTSGDMTATLLTFLQTLEQAVGRTPMIYTTPAFWDRYYHPAFSRYPLWLSEVGVIMPKVPFGWTNWTLWQRKINQSIDGVEKDADISILHPALELKDIVAQSSNPDAAATPETTSGQ
ncbi:MAG: hypothetical protein Tsb002_33600 [Wenzhouxiangellaceae bacterium]